MSIDIRDALLGDAPAIHRIFNESVPVGAIVWREKLAELSEVKGWIEGPKARQAVMVAEREGEVIGYATLAPFKPGPGWHVSTEISLYVAEGVRSGGVGGALCDAICAKAAELGCVSVISAIDAGNPRSVTFHERHGFTTVGTLRRAGVKHGSLRDVVLLERLLGDEL